QSPSGGLLNVAGKLALDVFDVDLRPALSEFAIDKSTALVHIEAKFPTGGGDPQKFPLLSRIHHQIGFDDVVAFKAHGGDPDMFIGHGRIGLTPEHPQPFPTAWDAHRFQLVQANVGSPPVITPRRVRVDQSLQIAHEVLQELRLWAIGFQNGPDGRAEFDSLFWRYC